MYGESGKIIEPKGLRFFNEVYEITTSSVWTESHGRIVIR